MVDAHAHFIPQEVMRWLRDNKRAINAKWEDRGGKEHLIINGKWPFSLNEPFVNKELFEAQQDQANISHSLVSPLPQLFLYDFPSEITLELSTVYNNSLIDQVKNNSERYSALATIPLNDPEKAAMELTRAMKLGMKGAIIGVGSFSVQLTDERCRPLWEVADRLGAILFIHPLLNGDDRMNKRKMSTLSGVLWETTICATDLILSGLLDHYKNVKLLLAHGGGYFPYQIGRLNRGYDVWNDVSSPLEVRPSDYSRRFWYDSVLWNDDALDYLVKFAGADRIVPGSDFPFELSDWPPRHQNFTGWETLLEMKNDISEYSLLNKR
ncbi:amidohydrolase [Sporosarcina sp. PTS2304]|uniref:amidohydrolase family protein n=1 Tax=Sporosarcina sp. PTS2304 TaxID=2283194 RepID=UPI000E0CE8B3|nr:amidohydrolase family protein [Sporosarcina sp. PTS2304]AXH99033.1 amidohydrolase [Sporosarcina sp. PTS2304]